MAFIPTSLTPRLPSHKRSHVLHQRTCAPHRQAPVQMGRRSEKIKGRKDAQTQARTKIFSRVGKIITMAAKAGGPDLIANKALADAIEAAKAVNFPKDTMEKAISRATNADQADFKASSFEAYGYGGTAIYIDVLTDNANRAAAGIRTAINKSKMKVASPGSVAFNFERKGVVRIEASQVKSADDLLMDAIDAGVEECDLDPSDDAVYRLTTEPGLLYSMRRTLLDAKYEVDLAQVEMVAKTVVEISDEDMDLNMIGVEALEALDDVDGVYTNAVLGS